MDETEGRVKTEVWWPESRRGTNSDRSPPQVVDMGIPASAGRLLDPGVKSRALWWAQWGRWWKEGGAGSEQCLHKTERDRQVWRSDTATLNGHMIIKSVEMIAGLLVRPQECPTPAPIELRCTRSTATGTGVTNCNTSTQLLRGKLILDTREQGHSRTWIKVTPLPGWHVTHSLSSIKKYTVHRAHAQQCLTYDDEDPTDVLVTEIAKVRASLFQINGTKKEALVLPEADGLPVTLTEKVYVPVKEHPDEALALKEKRNIQPNSGELMFVFVCLFQFNFVGRILGPRGMTAKQLELETGCKIMVRGRGSMRDKKKEELNRGKPNWEHLNDELHVLITVEDTENRANLKMERAVEEVKKLLIPADGEDELKKRQLMELAIINGTYRDSNAKAAAAAACDEEWRRLTAAAAAETQRLLSPGMPGMGTPMRSPATPLGAPLILSPRLPVPTSAASLLNGSGHQGPLLFPS
uniref:K Homology domain-containing protein n=1 Tax=Timema douglasi TaxID=61478 RepID=A0A7R8Z864_TIMDO|nr:unnamed protein product [Timema douglasi]